MNTLVESANDLIQFIRAAQRQDFIDALEAAAMTQTFTFTVKYPVGTRVFLADSSGAYLAQYHPTIVTGVVKSFEYLPSRQVVRYHFESEYNSTPFSRDEDQVFDCPEDVAAWYDADIDRQVLEMKEATARAIVNFRTNPKYAGLPGNVRKP